MTESELLTGRALYAPFHFITVYTVRFFRHCTTLHVLQTDYTNVRL